MTASHVGSRPPLNRAHPDESTGAFILHLRKFRIPLFCAAAFCALLAASPGILAVEDGEPPSPTRHAAVHHQYEADDARAAGSSHEGEKMIIPFMLAFVVILMAAKVGGDIFERIGQPAVLENSSRSYPR